MVSLIACIAYAFACASETYLSSQFEITMMMIIMAFAAHLKNNTKIYINILNV